MIPREAYHPQIADYLAGLLESESLKLFGVAGVAATEESGEAITARREYGEWLEAGHHGGMGYLSRHAEMKYAPGRVLDGCRSVIIVGANYFQTPSGTVEAPAGRVARYAWGRDYHNALGKRLKRVVRQLRSDNPGERFRSFVDASPLSERFFAEAAGVGFTAKNTLTISSAYGSWFFLGEIVSTAEYPATPAPPGIHGGCPQGCFRCGNICPTAALYAPNRIDASRCISYLTIEHRGRIPVELRPLMGDWVFGCDLCQEVCPLNVRAVETTVEDFRAHRAGESLRLAEILEIPDDDAYRSRFAGTPLLRPGRAAMIRNAAIAAANTNSVDLLPRLRVLANDTNEVIREHARWAVGVLTPQ